MNAGNLPPSRDATLVSAGADGGNYCTAMAVTNAEPGVRAVVDRILPSNEDHGVALLLEELVDAYV